MKIPNLMILPILIALFCIFSGFVLGGIFGAVEDSLKEMLNQRGTIVLADIYKGDVEKKNAVVKKSWEYFQRAHLHAGAIGTAALASTLSLIVLCEFGLVSTIASLIFSLGAIIYSLFWLLAGLAAPALGSTSAAKDSLEVMAIAGAAMCIMGAALTILVVFFRLFKRA